MKVSFCRGDMAISLNKRTQILIIALLVGTTNSPTPLEATVRLSKKTELFCHKTLLGSGARSHLPFAQGGRNYCGHLERNNNVSTE